MYRGRRGADTRCVSVPHHDTAPEYTLPSLDLRLIARRAALPLALAVAVVAVLVLAGGRLGVFADAFDRVTSADPTWIAVAAVAELLSFGGYIALFWLVGHRATPRLGLRASAEITFGGAAATRLLPTAGAGGAAMTLWAIARTGLGARRGGHVLLTFLTLLYSVFLVGIALSGAALALGLGGDAAHPLAAGAASLAATAAIVTGIVLGRRGAPAVPAVGRLRSSAALLGGAIRDAFGLLRGGDARLLGGPAWWAFDAAVLWAAFHALGQPPAIPILVFAYFAGQVGNTIPLPGAVSGGMVGTLLAFGVAPDLALSAVLTYRTVAIWCPAPFGLAALGALKARVGRWDRDEADAPAPAPMRPAMRLTPKVAYSGSTAA